MKIGYTCREDHRNDLERYCDEVIVADIQKQTFATFVEFIEKNLVNDIYIMNHLDLGLQLIQLLPGLKLLDCNNRYLRFLEKGFEGNISDQMYQKLLLHLAQNEKNIMSNRMKLEYVTAKQQGLKKSGRPQVDEWTVLQIRDMYYKQNKTLKEVAENCDVSIGTAYKYAIQLQGQYETNKNAGQLYNDRH